MTQNELVGGGFAGETAIGGEREFFGGIDISGGGDDEFDASRGSGSELVDGSKLVVI